MPFLVGGQNLTAEQLKQKIADLMLQIQRLQMQLEALQNQNKPWCHTFNVNLRVGDRGAEIAALQTALSRTDIDTGTGSEDPAPVFVERVASAVSAFQEKYRDEILTPLGLTHGTGYVGPATRKKLNQLYGCSKPQPYLPPRPYPSPVACTQDAKHCPDGSYVSRTGPKCEFAACPNLDTPTIFSISPLSGSQGTTLKIYGKNFSLNTNIVTLKPRDVNLLPAYDISTARNIKSTDNGTIITIALSVQNFYYGDCRFVGGFCQGSLTQIPAGEYDVIVSGSVSSSNTLPFTVVAQ